MQRFLDRFGNNFNDFPENQPAKFFAAPLTYSRKLTTGPISWIPGLLYGFFSLFQFFLVFSYRFSFRFSFSVLGLLSLP